MDFFYIKQCCLLNVKRFIKCEIYYNCMGVPLLHFSVFARNINNKTKYMFNQYKWCQIIKENGAKDKTANEFFKFCVKRGVFEKVFDTSLYKLSKNYKNIIIKIFCAYLCYDGSNFVDNIENYVEIVVD